MTKKELLEALEDITEDETVTFVVNSVAYTTISETVKVIDRDQRSDFLEYKLYIDLDK